MARHNPLFIELNSKSKSPSQCTPLISIHGQSLFDSWISQSYKQNQSISELCQSALNCKVLLHPLLSSSGQLRTACKNDCSNNGKCKAGGKCECKTGFSGDDCSISECTEKCSNNGTCIRGQCLCDPGRHGSYCQKRTKCGIANGRECAGNGVCKFGKCFCNPGYAGEKCNQIANCPKECMGRGLCVYGVCFCKKGWGGNDCSEPMLSDAKCTNDCSGRGRCEHGHCKCDFGYYGEDCSNEMPCPKGTNQLPCSGHGSCNAGQCECKPGYYGFKCSLKSKCPGDGRCSDNGVCIKGTCYCRPGFSGPSCSKPTCPACKKGQGDCYNGKCVCLSGYYGNDCSKTLPGVTPVPNNSKLDQQFSQSILKAALGRGRKCINGCSGVGTCFNGTCACIPGFAGTDCSQIRTEIKCPNECSYRGVCVFGTCRCVDGYSGVDCSIVDGKSEKDSLQLLRQCPNACSGRGTCKKKPGGLRSCECDDGYGGIDCSTPIPCPKNCNGRGRCSRGRCFCNPGFSGSDCSEIARCNNGCNGRGTCFYGKCFCHPFYTGEDCSKTPHCPSGCGKHGTCRGNDICACDAGWGGVSCSEKLTCDKDCSGPSHGRCVATSKGVKCVCNAKYTGKYCQLDVMKCKKDCKNGVCLNGKCVCNTGYSGEDCSLRVNMGQTVMSNIAFALNQAKQNSSNPRFKQLTQNIMNNNKFSNMNNNNNNNNNDGASKARFAETSDGTCPNNCNGHGVCANGQCFCNPGHTGTDCGTVMKCPNDCSNNGICKYGQCWCGPNYVGQDCSLYTTAGRKFPPIMITGIIASITFFVGIIVGRKTLAKSGLKFAQSLSEPELRDPIS